MIRAEEPDPEVELVELAPAIPLEELIPLARLSKVINIGNGLIEAKVDDFNALSPLSMDSGTSMNFWPRIAQAISFNCIYIIRIWSVQVYILLGFDSFEQL